MISGGDPNSPMRTWAQMAPIHDQSDNDNRAHYPADPLGKPPMLNWLLQKQNSDAIRDRRCS
jgi:hypothetical protein